MLAVTLPFAMILAQVFRHDFPSHLLWFALGVSWALALFDLSQRLVNANLAPMRYVVMGTVKSTLALLLSLLVLQWSSNTEGVILALVVSLLVSSLFAGVFWSGMRLSNFDKTLLIRLFQYGAPLTITYVLIMVIDASDRYFLAAFRGAAAVGEYAPVYDFSQQSLGMLMGVIYLASNPLVLRALQVDGEEAARFRVIDTGKLLIAIALPVTVGFVIESHNISRLLLGSGVTSESAKVLAIVATAVFVGGIRAYYFDFSFQLKAKLSGQVWVFAWAALVNTLFNFLLIPHYGLVGAAISTLFAFTVSLLLSWYFGRQLFRLPLWNADLSKIVLATMVMAGYLCWFGGGEGFVLLVVNALIAIALYGLSLYALDVCGARQQCARLYNRILN